MHSSLVHENYPFSILWTSEITQWRIISDISEAQLELSQWNLMEVQIYPLSMQLFSFSLKFVGVLILFDDILIFSKNGKVFFFFLIAI